MANVVFNDMSLEVEAALDATTIKWLYAWAEEITSTAKTTCEMGKNPDDGDDAKQLSGSYAYRVDDSAGKAQIGTPLEAGYWEEFGTGEYAAHGDGRKGWWIYCKGQPTMGGGQTYATKEEALAMAAYIRARYKKEAIVTNGRRPSHTLENAFKGNQAKAKADLEAKLKERMEE